MSGAARATDPDTSHDAARSLHDLPARRRAVLALLREYGPMTDTLLVETYDAEVDAGTLLPTQSHSGIRTRRSELVTLGLVVDTGFRWKLASGRHAIVWRASS